MWQYINNGVKRWTYIWWFFLSSNTFCHLWLISYTTRRLKRFYLQLLLVIKIQSQRLIKNTWFSFSVTMCKSTTRYTICTWDCSDHWSFYLNLRSEYFGICTTWWNNNNALIVNSCTKLQIIGPKVLNPWFIRQMLGEVFNDLVSPTNHEGFNVFTWFNGHVYDGVKVIQYCTPLSLIFSIKHKR
jgi:hypothetical protein